MTTKLEAILLAAGSGSRMVELTRGKPKCLLPVGNHSLIWFAITTLRTIGVERIICLIPDSHENEIKQYCHKKFNSLKDLSLEFVSIVTENDCGTAESILSIKDRIRGDFIVFSCDTIVNPQALHAMLNHYRLYDSTLTMLFSDNASYFDEKQVPGRSDKEKVLRDIVAVESLDEADKNLEDLYSENKVVFLNSERDAKSKLKVRNRELALHPMLNVYSCFLDTHVYICKRQVLEFMEEHSQKVVLKGEIIPLLISKQFSRGKQGNSEQDEDDVNEMGFNSKNTDYEIELKEKLEAFRPRNFIHSFQRIKPPSSIDCHALIKKDLLVYRVNTIGSFLNCNRESRQILNIYGAKTNFVKDCLVGEGTQIGDKCTLKKSCVGNNCKIGDKVKLFDCVIMDNVEIESNSSLAECIVSPGSKIGSKCDLKLCIVGSKQTIPAGRKSKNEVMIDAGYAIDLGEPIIFE